MTKSNKPAKCGQLSHPKPKELAVPVQPLRISPIFSTTSLLTHVWGSLAGSSRLSQPSLLGQLTRGPFADPRPPLAACILDEICLEKVKEAVAEVICLQRLVWGHWVVDCHCVRFSDLRESAGCSAAWLFHLARTARAEAG